MNSIGYARYGMSDYGPAAVSSAASNGAVTTGDAHTGSVNAENPFVWLFGIAGVTLGLIAASTHVRVGNVRAGVDVGTP